MMLALGLTSYVATLVWWCPRVKPALTYKLAGWYIASKAVFLPMPDPWTPWTTWNLNPYHQGARQSFCMYMYPRLDSQRLHYILECMSVNTVKSASALGRVKSTLAQLWNAVPTYAHAIAKSHWVLVMPCCTRVPVLPNTLSSMRCKGDGDNHCWPYCFTHYMQPLSMQCPDCPDIQIPTNEPSR